MVNKREIIEIKPKFILLIITFMIIIFIVLIRRDNKRISTYIMVNHKMKIDSINITGNEINYGLTRGAIFFKEVYYIKTSSKLVENKDNYNKWQYEPIISFNPNPPEHRLFDLGFPFIIYKKANNDTLNVIKDGYNLKFLIQYKGD